MLTSSCFTLAASTALDYAITGRLMIPTLTFIHQNIVRNISSFYGATDPFYHLVQSLPLMLFPIWYWWGQGFMSCLLPSRPLPRRLADLDRPDGLRTLARALTFTTVALSLSPHSEWRFLHPLLPPMLLFALPPLCRDFTPTILGCYRLTQSIRQYTRISKFPFYLCLFAPLAPWLYLNVAHGRAQVAVMDVLRTGQVGDVTSLVILAPCHSVPWMSRLHKDVAGWFLTCEPPLE
jgi:phosphatidylinositol glycan class B